VGAIGKRISAHLQSFVSLPSTVFINLSLIAVLFLSKVIKSNEITLSRHLFVIIVIALFPVHSLIQLLYDFEGKYQTKLILISQFQHYFLIIIFLH